MIKQDACALKQQAEMQKYVAQEEAIRQARDIQQQDMCMAEVELLHLKISQYEGSCWNR